MVESPDPPGLAPVVLTSGDHVVTVTILVV